MKAKILVKFKPVDSTEDGRTYTLRWLRQYRDAHAEEWGFWFPMDEEILEGRNVIQIIFDGDAAETIANVLVKIKNMIYEYLNGATWMSDRMESARVTLVDDQQINKNLHLATIYNESKRRRKTK